MPRRTTGPNLLGAGTDKDGGKVGTIGVGGGGSKDKKKKGKKGKKK